jgi:hypothetical protein
MLHDNENLPDYQKIGGNFPPEALEPELAPEDKRIAALVANADAHVAEHPIIEDEEAGDAAANFLKQLKDHYDALKQKFDEEKVPHEEKLAEIRAKYHPRLDRLQTCIKSIRPRVRAWISLLENRRKAEEADRVRAAAEAQRHADQLAEQAAAGSRNAVTNTIAAAEAAREADMARKAVAEMPKRVQVRPSLGGHTLSLRTVWYAEIVEWDKCYRHFQDNAKVRKLVQSLANEAARSIAAEAARHRLPKPVQSLPGCEIYSKQE